MSTLTLPSPQNMPLFSSRESLCQDCETRPAELRGRCDRCYRRAMKEGVIESRPRRCIQKTCTLCRRFPRSKGTMYCDGCRACAPSNLVAELPRWAESQREARICRYEERAAREEPLFELEQPVTWKVPLSFLMAMGVVNEAVDNCA